MGDITKNISRHELKCKCGTCCGHENVDFATINAIQCACNHFAIKLGLPKVTLVITSAARCYEYNRSIGSTDHSKHPKSSAVDHYIKEVPLEELREFYEANWFNTFGIGYYPEDNFIHLDSRKEKARWVG